MEALIVAIALWTFDSELILQQWVPNGHMANARVEDGALHIDAIDWDPFLVCRDIEIEVTPWQYVVVRVKADQPGAGELFWTGQTTGQYEGFSQGKRTSFNLRGDGAWEEAVILPFWHGEGTLRKMRLDLYEGAHFVIGEIRVMSWAEGKSPVARDTWSGEDIAEHWIPLPNTNVIVAPPLATSLAGRGWVSVRAEAAEETVAELIWAGADGKAKTFPFTLRGGSHFSNLEVAGDPAWPETLQALALRLPEKAQVRVTEVAIADGPRGASELSVIYFGFENGANRAGRPVRLLGQFTNVGGGAGGLREASLAVPDGMRILSEPDLAPLQDLEHGDLAQVAWEIAATEAGRQEVTLSFAGEGAPDAVTAQLDFLPARATASLEYVPEPRPIETDLDVCMYYFPGWGNEAAWDCVWRTAPVRKPLLGYYDEAKPACVDWQIKWAVENGISCFLVDWYWNQGGQHLLHWFEAYREARYRGHLDVAIMWANHNPKGSHSREDWRNVTREWIDNYFGLDTYYRIDGKPALFLWDPNLLRSDLGGTEEVRAALAESQAMAREAGYDGITFVAVNRNESAANAKRLAGEGFHGATNYHEWGDAFALGPAPKRARFEDVVKTVPTAWERREADRGGLVYYPLVDSGWDARPWHGNQARAILGRTTAGFERLMTASKAFCQKHERGIVVLGPANEWGEGSYVEPNTEFGFSMYEAVRRVFATTPQSAWPENLAPGDVGLGPYDFPRRAMATSWTFDTDTEGWGGMMHVRDMRWDAGALCFQTTTNDPALRVATGDLKAREFEAIGFRMRIQGEGVSEAAAQLFWSVGNLAMSGATSMSFPVQVDGEYHDYRLPLGEHPRWRGRVTSLRFDPCNIRGAEIAIDGVAFERRE